MKKILLLSFIVAGANFSFSQTITFDNINSNVGHNKSIIWNTASFGSGFGHKIYSFDPGSKTNLRIAGRHNSTTWTDILTITSDGRVGIGTTDPLRQFHVIDLPVGSNSGNIRSSVRFEIGRQKLEFKSVRTVAGSDWSNTTLKLQASIDATDHQSIDFVNDGSKNEHIDILTGNQVFNTRFTHNGRVGIGTTNPQSTLAVNGKITAKEIQVTLSGWADFVFLKDYCLRPLSEVEAFINENGHLPEIPSAEEVKENGINLGEMDAKLLQKIEELTLYMIEQNRRIEKLENENALLKTKF